MLELINEFRKDGVNVKELNDLLKMFFERERNEDEDLLLPKILHLTENLPVSKVKQIRFEI